MRGARWSLLGLAAGLVLCPLAASGVAAALVSCHQEANDDGFDCCQPLAGSSRPPSPPALQPLAVAVLASPCAPASGEPATFVGGAPEAPRGAPAQAALSVYRI
jgi:hypothetical protein